MTRPVPVYLQVPLPLHRPEQQSLFWVQASPGWPSEQAWQAGSPAQSASSQSTAPSQSSSTPPVQTSAPMVQSRAQLPQSSPLSQLRSPQQ